MTNQYKICAIICEFNPLHNGHAYAIQKARELSKCDYVIAIMSGNFSQRAEPCIAEKYIRTQIAMDNGIDAVVHLPTAYSINSSEIFSKAGVKIANAFKNVTHLYFSSECGDIDKLTQIAHFFNNEPKIYKTKLRCYLSQGYSYNISKQKTIEDLTKENIIDESFQNIIKHPNNILGIEYIRQLLKIKSNIIPITSKRIGQEYNSEKIDEYSSASAIRQNILDKRAIKKTMPANAFDELYDYFENNGYQNLDLYKNILFSNIRIGQISKHIFEAKEGLNNRIYFISNKSNNYDEFLEKAKTKRFNETKIKRIVLNSTLNITSKIIKKLYTKQLPYIKLLGAKKQILPYLNCTTKLVIRNQKSILNNYAKQLITIEEKADSLFMMIGTSRIVYTPYFLRVPIII